MPTRAKLPCRQPGCGALVNNSGYCPEHGGGHDRRVYGTAAQRGYGHAWQKARRIHLASEPLCRLCQGQGRVTAAIVVDHIIPHRGDMTRFWDRTNWQSLCGPHNRAKTADGR